MAAQDTLVPGGVPPSRTAPITVVPDPQSGQYGPGQTGVWGPGTDPWVGRLMALADYVLAKAPTGGGGGRIAAAVAVLYLLVVANYAAFAAHLVGDGTVKAKAARTDCHVEWLVMRAVADDRGEPPPPFDPLACDRR